MSGIKRKDSRPGADQRKKQKVTVDTRMNGGPGKLGVEDTQVGSLPTSNASKADAFVGHDSGHQNKPATSSAEAHAKQRQLAKERKASKPNADVVKRSKQIWERLRIKSHVPKDERQQLVVELFSIIQGRIRDFVFKHDSVRVIQCALKYANKEQRMMIVQELRQDIRTLAESRYGKFLVARMVQEGDRAGRDTVVPEFYGHIRRLMNNSEAAWIVDDIYRQVATSEQKAQMLREWYGAEFALFHRKTDLKNDAVTSNEDTADLSLILRTSPEKRKPILQYLLQMINALIQKKMTGFTMLHDAMLQYFLACVPSSDEHREFLEILKGDIDKEEEGGGGDLFRNLAFTKSGSRLVCLALAHGTSKDRKTMLKVYKGAVDMMAFDQNAYMVLLTGLEVPDDTKMSSRAILAELLGDGVQDEAQRLDRLESVVINKCARLPVLYPMAGGAKWLGNDLKRHEKYLLDEVQEIRRNTSKKDPRQRHEQITEYMSTPLLELVAQRTSNLAASKYGCQFMTETLLEAKGNKEAAKRAVAELAAGDPKEVGHACTVPTVSRMLKALVSGGKFDAETKVVTLSEPRLGFAAALYPVIREHVVDWACSDSSFVIVALLESQDVDADVKDQVRARLNGEKERLEASATDVDTVGTTGKDGRDTKSKANAGARLLLEQMV